MSQTLPQAPFFKGYVTVLAAVEHKSKTELERALGFNTNALRQGYRLYALMGLVGLNEFEWKDRTRYSDGWHADPTIKLSSTEDLVWSVQRQDELRAALGKQHGYDEKATDRAISDIMAKQLAKLNVRVGPDRIVKVVLNSPPTAYPDAEFRNVPQWRLKTPKPFTLLSTH